MSDEDAALNAETQHVGRCDWCAGVRASRVEMRVDSGLDEFDVCQHHLTAARSWSSFVREVSG